MNHELRERLLEMAAEDRRVHTELSRSGEIFQGYAPRMAEVHLRNGRALEAIIAEVGWPGISLVGSEGAHAAWFILQHAVALPELQRRSLPLLQAAVARGEATAAAAAYLEDRIAFYERRPQRYGTQFDWDTDAVLRPWTLAEPDLVDELRRSVGLGPLAERIEQLRSETMPEHRPRDIAACRAEALAWARLVGWL